MKLKVKKTVEQEIEITFPYYTKCLSDHARYDDETNCVRVTSTHISISDGYPQDWLTDTPCTKAEFDAAFTETLNLIKAAR